MIDPFVRTALIGIARSEDASTNTPVDALTNDFLLRAGARDLYLRAGLKPPRMEDVHEKASDETLRACSPALANALAEEIGEGDADILRVIFAGLAEKRLHVPHPLLPAVLRVRERVLRARAVAVIGERGRWLARQNSAWSWAIDSNADAATQWEEGNEQQQIDALHALRAIDAANARERLIERLPQERAERRAALLGGLMTNLSGDDEELLEQMLKDRSSVVQSAASELLARLPSSAFVQRAQAKLEALVRFEENKSVWSKIGLGKSAKLVIEDSKELAQIAGAVPLAWWTSHMPIEEWFEQANEQLIEGWTIATIRQRNATWANALIQRDTKMILALLEIIPTNQLDEVAAGDNEKLQRIIRIRKLIAEEKTT